MKMLVATLMLGWSVFYKCNATCSPQTLSNAYGIVYYGTDKNEDCTWTFVPSPNIPSDLLIIDMFYVHPFNSHKDKIVFPDNTQPISDDIYAGNEGTCRSYRISNDQTKNCTNEFSNQYCQQPIDNLANTTATLKSSHVVSGDNRFSFLFSYLFLDCPLKLELSSATTSVYSATLSSKIEITTKGNNTANSSSLSEQESNQVSFMIPVIVLAVILGVSWILMFLLILFIKRRKKYFKAQINTPAGMKFDQSKNHPLSNNTSNMENHTSSSSGYEINDQPTSGLTNDISTREMVDNVLYQESPTLSKATFAKEPEVTNQQGIYSIPDGQSTREMVENTLYHAFAGNN